MVGKYSHSLLINLTIFALVIYGITIFRYAFNQPVGDDYEAILGFLNQYTQTNWLRKIDLIFSQHNEHRIVLTRVFSLLDFYIIGKINFVHLIWLGTLGWLLSIYSLWRLSQSSGIRLSQFMPVAILLVAFSHFDTMTWAMASIQQYYQILFALICIGLMVNQRFVGSIIAYICGAFTGGGGLVLGPLMVVFYFSQRQWRSMWLTLFVGLLLYLTYFKLLDYRPPSQNHIELTWPYIQLWISYTLGFIGSAANLAPYGISFAIFMGCLAAILFLFKAKSALQHTPQFFWVGIYVILLGIVTALNRSDLGLASSSDSRYSPYSLILLACIYLIYIGSTASARIKNIILFAGLTISIGGFMLWHSASQRPLIDRLHWLKNDLPVHPNWEHAKAVRQESERLGIFHGQ